MVKIAEQFCRELAVSACWEVETSVVLHHEEIRVGDEVGERCEARCCEQLLDGILVAPPDVSMPLGCQERRGCPLTRRSSKRRAGGGGVVGKVAQGKVPHLGRLAQQRIAELAASCREAQSRVPLARVCHHHRLGLVLHEQQARSCRQETRQPHLVLNHLGAAGGAVEEE